MSQPGPESIHVECFLGPNNLWPTDRDVLPRVIVFNSLSFVLPLSDISSSDDRPRMTSHPAGLDTDLFNVVQNVIWSSVKERREELLE